MTWHTPNGDRVLRGDEAELVRESLANLIDEFEVIHGCHADPWDFGIAAFDELSVSQQLAILSRVAQNLLTVTPNPLDLTAVCESAVGVVFENVKRQIEIELDWERIDPQNSYTDDHYYWRRLVLNASLDALADDGGIPLPKVTSRDMAEWTLKIESLADRILWDRDYEMASPLLDMSPAKAELIKSYLGINDNYYTAIADDPRTNEIASLLDSVRAITHTKPR